jgi:hypothetical protein
MAAKSKPWGPTARTWHRRLTWVLLAQLTIWVVTAMGMTMVPRAAITAYKPGPDAVYDARADWPSSNALAAAAPNAVAVSLERGASLVPLLSVRDLGAEEPRRLSPSLAPPERLAPEVVAAHAAAIARAPAGGVMLVTRHGLEFQKHDLPAYRVETPKAPLFFDPVSGELIEQAPPARIFENLMKTVHVMDYTGGAVFRQNVLLTAFAVMFALATLLGVVSVRRMLFLKTKGSLAVRLHQGLGLLLAVQAFLWISSGLSVVWLLHPARAEAETHLSPPVVIEWARVRQDPAQILAAEPEPPARITLTMLLGTPVFQVAWPGRGARQALFDAETGAALTLSIDERDRIAAAALAPAAAASITRWEEAKSPKDLDFYFYIGPYPVWKAFYDKPSTGAIAIDQITGHVHAPRIDREIAIEQFYNMHVLNWEGGVVKYRQEPLLIAAITLLGLLVLSGLLLQLRRLPQKNSPQGSRPRAPSR